MKPIEKTQQREVLDSIDALSSDVMAGLSSPQKFLPSRYFYDKTGSLLFEKICDQPEYYPTRTEADILQAHSESIAKHLNDAGDGIAIIELGSGSSTKTRILLDEFQTAKSKICYFPIDISREMLQETTARLKSQLPGIDIFGIPSDYSEGIEHVNRMIENDPHIPSRKLILFLGSSFGNFEAKQSISFFRMLRSKMTNQDYLMVGFDLHKDPKVLNAAYNDQQGITAKFNLNLLSRINRELGADFDLSKFGHFAFYNLQHHRIEMHLVSKAEHDVYVNALGRSFLFREGESIHTENSYKYTERQINEMARQSCLEIKDLLMDRKNWFAVAILRRTE